MLKKSTYIRKIAFITVFFLCSGILKAENVRLNGSVFDFTGKDFNGVPISLEGEWDFYWNQFIAPDDQLPDVSEKIYLPDSWNKNKRYPVFGYGTYHTVLLLPENLKQAGIEIPFTLNHYKIFMNGNLLAESGVVNSMQSEDSGSVKPPRVLPLSSERKFDIIIQVSNFDDFHGGLTDALKICLYETQILKKTRHELFEAILFGAYLITGLLYISFYISRRIDKSSLLFGLFCIVLAFRTILYGEYLSLVLFPGLSMETVTALGHMTYYIAFPLFLRFIAVTYPFKLLRWIEYPVYIISSIYVFLAFFLAHRVYIFFLTYYQIISVIGCIFIIIDLIFQSYKKDVFAKITIIGFIVFFGTAINDILFTQNIIQTFYMTPLGLGLFIITQASLMTWRISIAFSSAETLSGELTITNHSFKRFVPEEILKFLKKEKIADVNLGDHTQMEMTILFLDIRNFTTMSEKMEPRENFDFLNSFFDRVCPVIRKNGGFIDKYLGDGIMALFPGKADHAVKSGVEMLEMLKVYNSHRAKCNYPPIKIGIGIHTGSLMLGTIGEPERMDGTVISDAVNLCSRLESVTKEYQFNIAISEDTYNSLEDHDYVRVRSVGKIPLKGKQQLVSIYELFNGDDTPLLNKKEKYRKEFEEAVSLLDDKKYNEARTLFQRLTEKFPEDPTTQVYLNKIRKPRSE